MSQLRKIRQLQLKESISVYELSIVNTYNFSGNSYYVRYP